MEKMAKRGYKRRQYFIDRKFQSDYIIKFCALVVLGGLLTIGLLYLLAMRSTTVSIVDSRVVVRSTADFLLPLLVQTVAVVTILIGIAVMVVAVLLSHKIAGPLYRFQKEIKNLENGDFTTEFRIRKMDQLQDLAENFNQMIKKTREELTQLKTNFISLKEKIDGISEQELSENKRHALSEMKRISQELNRIIHYFKI